MGLRLHCGALDKAVAVRSRSGWRMRRFALEVMVIDSVTEDEDGEMRVNVPNTLMTSPIRRNERRSLSDA